MTTSCRVDIAEAYWGRHKKVVVSDVGPISGRGQDGIGPTSGLRWKQHVVCRFVIVPVSET